MIDREKQCTNPIQSIPIQSIGLYGRTLITDSIDIADYGELCIYIGYGHNYGNPLKFERRFHELSS